MPSRRLLFSSLVPTRAKIAIANQKYYVSPARFVISHHDPKMIKWLFNYLNEDDDIFSNINGLLDGFKITYAKISKDNLLHQVYFKNDQLAKY